MSQLPQPGLLLRTWPGGSLVAGSLEDGGTALMASVSMEPETDRLLGGIRESEWLRRLGELATALPLDRRFCTERSSQGLQLCFSELHGIPLARSFSRQDADEALAVLRLMATALVDHHRAGVPYLMIQPASFMVDDQERLAVAEPGVGLAVVMGLHEKGVLSQQVSLRLGVDSRWIPPELVLPDRALSCATDVFLLAALVVSWIAGDSPFGGGLSLELTNRILKGQMPGLQRIEDRLDAPRSQLLRRCLQADSSARPRDASELLELLGGEPASLGFRGSRVRYSSLFVDAQTMAPGDCPFRIAPHEGDIGVLPEELEPATVLKNVGEKNRRITDRKPSAREPNLKLWVTALAIIALAGIAMPLLVERWTGQPRLHEGRLPENSDGLTHRDMVWNRGDAQVAHPTATSLVSAVPSTVKRALLDLNMDITEGFVFVQPVLPPYRLTRDGTEGRIQLQFATRNRLDSVTLTINNTTVLVKLLYDGEGRASGMTVAREMLPLEYVPLN